MGVNRYARNVARKVRSSSGGPGYQARRPACTCATSVGFSILESLKESLFNAVTSERLFKIALAIGFHGPADAARNGCRAIGPANANHASESTSGVPRGSYHWRFSFACSPQATPSVWYQAKPCYYAARRSCWSTRCTGLPWIRSESESPSSTLQSRCGIFPLRWVVTAVKQFNT